MEISNDELLAKFGRFQELLTKLLSRVVLDPSSTLFDVGTGMMLGDGPKNVQMGFFLDTLTTYTKSHNLSAAEFAEVWEQVLKYVILLRDRKSITINLEGLDFADLSKLGLFVEFWLTIAESSKKK